MKETHYEKLEDLEIDFNEKEESEKNLIQNNYEPIQDEKLTYKLSKDSWIVYQLKMFSIGLCHGFIHGSGYLFLGQHQKAIIIVVHGIIVRMLSISFNICAHVETIPQSFRILFVIFGYYFYLHDIILTTLILADYIALTERLRYGYPICKGESTFVIIKSISFEFRMKNAFVTGVPIGAPNIWIEAVRKHDDYLRK